MHLDDLGDLYVRLLADEAAAAPGGTVLLATSDGPHPVWRIAGAASRPGGAEGRIEVRPFDEAMEDLGDRAYARTLDQRLSGEKAQRLLN